MEETESLLSRRRDGERVSSAGSMVGLGSGAEGKVVVAAPSEGSLGGVVMPSDETNGDAPTFKNLSDAGPSNESGVTRGVGRVLMAI